MMQAAKIDYLTTPLADVAPEEPLSEVSDEQLMMRLQGGDTDAFGELVRRYRPWIFKRCLWKLENEADADDAAQEVLFVIFRCCHQFKPDRKFAAWLNNVIRNRVFMAFDQRTRRRRLLKKIANTPPRTVPPSCWAESREELGERTWLDVRSAIQTGLSQVTETQSEVLRMVYFEGLNLNQVAKVRNRSKSAGAFSHEYGLKKLRALLPPWMERITIPESDATITPA